MLVRIATAEDDSDVRWMARNILAKTAWACLCVFAPFAVLGAITFIMWKFR